MIKLHNTLGNSVEEFVAHDPNHVKIYTCGLTVYSQPHIGNWLGYIYWDILVRVLKENGYSVERTQNITDVGHLTSDDDSGEDKIEKGAEAEGVTAWDIAKKYSAVAEREASELGLLQPDHLEPASKFVDQQIEFAKVLETKGYTYVIPGDGLYFDTSRLQNYGQLARLDIAGLEAGTRVSVAGKRNITDFAVWKFSPSGKKRDMEWESPWGKGFPGWHLECSVIARETLGDQIDIHTGGIDHIPVHHSNEIAQTEAVTGKQFSTFWLHNNHIKVDGQKMSKSLGNIYTLSDIVEHGFSLDAFRMLALSKHYRTEGNFTWDILEASQNRLQHWRDVACLRWQTHDTLEKDDDKDTDYNVNGVVLSAPHSALEALTNDLNTPEALVAIERALDAIHTASPSILQHSALVQLVDWIDNVLGLRIAETTPDINDTQKQLVIERQRARDEKNWRRSDELRDLLAEQGIILRDTNSRTVWTRADKTSV